MKSFSALLSFITRLQIYFQNTIFAKLWVVRGLGSFTTDEVGDQLPTSSFKVDQRPDISPVNSFPVFRSLISLVVMIDTNCAPLLADLILSAFFKGFSRIKINKNRHRPFTPASAV